MDTTQISTIVNSVNEQAIGETAITAYNTGGVVSLGNVVLSSQANTDAWLGTLVQRIGRTIISTRSYRNKLRDMTLNDMEYGAIVQKVKTDMPEATDDEMWEVQEDGTSVDHYIVANPKTHQKLFVTRAPYKFFITIKMYVLREAFLSEEALGSFIASIFTEVQNKIELTNENLGRVTIASFMAEISDKPDRVINLVSRYNAETGETLTATSALHSEAFLRYAVSVMKEYSDYFTDLGMQYNDGTTTRHTPFEDQRLRIISGFERRLETVVEWMAFNERYVSLSRHSTLNFWQSANEGERNSIHVTRGSDGKEVQLSNIVAFLHDRDALGMYQKDEYVLTTPVNARAAYYNTFWHEKQLWFNDLSENGVIFTLN